MCKISQLAEKNIGQLAIRRAYRTGALFFIIRAYDTQVETWTRWYKNGEMHRFEQPVGKQYTYGKSPKNLSEIELVKNENLFLKQQIDI